MDNLIYNADFSVFYNKKNKLLSIGYDAEKMKLTDSYYDFLASEARQASFLAIAKKDIDEKHWSSLSRTLTTVDKYKGLISWSGTAFEYLMPNINMNSYYGSLLDESCKFMIMSQIKYANKNNIPWGISESAYSIKDLNSNYQYKAFGIPWLGLKRGLEDELVISPYSTFLGLNFAKEEAIKNLKRIDKENGTGEYGFYEAIDYTKSRLKENESCKVVKTYMAHHQGLILTSINNLLNKKILNKRFMENPEIESTDILLQEKMPNAIMISKKVNNKYQKQKYVNKFYDKELIYTKNEHYNRINVISSGDYTIVMDNHGNGYSKYKDVQLNRFKYNDINKYLNGFFIKNIKRNTILSTNEMGKLKKSEVKFSTSKMQYNIEDNGSEIEYTIIPNVDGNAEIRRLTLRNLGLSDEEFEITGVIEGIFSNIHQDIAHPVFNNMFLDIEYEKENDIFIIQRNDRDEKNSKYYFGIKMYSNNPANINNTRFEIDKEKFLGRKNSEYPDMVNNSQKFSSEIKDVVEPMLAINKQTTLKKNMEITIDFIIGISENREELLKMMDEYNNEEKRNSEFKLFNSKVEEEIKYLRLNGENIEIYQKLLGHLINKDIKKDEQVLKRVYNSKHVINDLWKYGISGDNLILTVKIKNIDEIECLREIIKAFEFFKVKNMNIDLCIINGENYSYETVLKELILQVIRESQLEYILNNKIFIIDEYSIEKDEVDFIYCKSDLFLDIKYGNLKLNLNEIEKKNLNDSIVKMKSKASIVYEDDKSYSDIVNKELLFFNGIGGFSGDGKQYIFKSDKKNEVPMPWINVLSNSRFGCITTDNFGGFIWNENSRLNRISKWNNEPTNDLPSEMLYIKDCDKNKYWSMVSRIANDMAYVIKYGYGYSEYIQVCDDILQNVTVYVPEKEASKNIIISLKNLNNNKRNFKLYYYMDAILGEDILKTEGNIICNYEKNRIGIKNIFSNQFEKEVFVRSSEKISKIYTSPKEFFGNNLDTRCPEAIIYKKENENSTEFFKSNSVVMECDIKLNEFEKKDIIIKITTDEETKNINLDEALISLEDTKSMWNQKLSRVKINTPSKQLNIFINGWCMYQTLASRILGRTAYYQSGGAIGYRDQLQDTLGLKFLDINYMKEFIIKAAKHQFIEGDVLHWWHESNGLGVRTKFSDDLLWLVYLVIEYIEFTGDYSILDISVPYVQGEKLDKDKLEECKIYNVYGREETIFEHCIRAIEKGINLGANNLPKIGTGDWNDGFSNIGSQGIGESIWLGFFIYDILKRFEKLLEKKDKIELIERYTIIREIIRKALNTFAWDGNWYIRATTDNGKVIGSNKNIECKIDSISQSWSVISEAGDNDKKYIAMESVKKYLIDKEEKLIKLLTPAFNNQEYNPGYISKYKNGIRENGGQYTHGVIWTVLALTKLEMREESFELIDMLNPLNHGSTEEEIRKYKGEPYVLAGDVYTNKDMYGKAGWTWYSGAASWFYKVVLENILGLQIQGNKLYIKPCVPKDWEEYSVNYMYKNTLYKILVKNNKKNDNGFFIKINGKIQTNDYIELLDDNRDFTIEIEM